MTDELAALDATAQADLVATGQVSATELVDAAIAAVEALNPTICPTGLSEACRS